MLSLPAAFKKYTKENEIFNICLSLQMCHTIIKKVKNNGQLKGPRRCQPHGLVSVGKHSSVSNIFNSFPPTLAYSHSPPENVFIAL